MGKELGFIDEKLVVFVEKNLFIVVVDYEG